MATSLAPALAADDDNAKYPAGRQVVPLAQGSSPAPGSADESDPTRLATGAAAGSARVADVQAARDERPRSDGSEDEPTPEEGSPRSDSGEDRSSGVRHASDAATSAAPSAPHQAARAEERTARLRVREPHARLPGWRGTLLAWAASPETGDAPPPLLPGTSLDRACRALALPPVAVRLVAHLYARHLGGATPTGLAPATAAMLIADDEEWTESLGRGALGATGAIRVREGRLRAHPALLRYLDGFAPRVALVEPRGAGVAIPPEAPALLLDDPPPDAAAVADELGRTVALLDLRAVPVERRPAQARRAVLEAVLHGVVALIVTDDDERLASEWVRALGRGAALVVVHGDCPRALDDVPPWDRARRSDG